MALNDLGIKVETGKAIKQFGGWVTGVGGNVESTSFGLNLIGSGEFDSTNLKKFSNEVFKGQSVVQRS